MKIDIDEVSSDSDGKESELEEFIQLYIKNSNWDVHKKLSGFLCKLNEFKSTKSIKFIIATKRKPDFGENIVTSKSLFEEGICLNYLILYTFGFISFD